MSEPLPGGEAGGEAAPGLSPELAAYHERARRVTEEVLAEPQFANLREAEPGWLEAATAWLRDLMLGLVELIQGLPGPLWWLVVVWMVLALAAVLAHLIWTLWRTVGGMGGERGGAGRTAGGPAGRVFGVDALSWESVDARARQLLGLGDWAGAVRHLYVAALLWLDRAGRVRFHPAKTNRDYLRELSAQAGLRERFEALTRLFEPVAYGGLPADSALCGRMDRNVREIRDETATIAKS